MFSLLLGVEGDRAPGQFDPDAEINLNPMPIRPDNDGRALGDVLMTIDMAGIGMPSPGYASGGLTWDGQYLYYENQNNHTMYVIDPTGPTIVNSFSLGLGHPWGIGHENLMWITDYASASCYEYQWNGTATGVSFPSVVGGASWMGDISEWWPDGEIWLLAVGGSNKIYKFSLPGGALLDSLSDPVWTGISQRALTYDPHNHTFWLGGWNDGICWEVDANTGSVLRQFSPSDGNIAGLAYDWQSTLHPTPVLWLATNAAADYIYMIDADNAQPPPPENILFVDDDDAEPYETYWETSFNNLGYQFDKWCVTDSGDVAPDSAAMANYTIVVWTTAYDMSTTLTATDTLEISKWLAAGGKLWLSSQDVLWDLGTSISWMHLAGYNNDVGADSAMGIGPVMGGTAFQIDGGVFNDYADNLVPDGSSWSELVGDDYADTIAVAIDTSAAEPYFLFFNAFGWENIGAQADRDTMMKRILTWMGFAAPPRDVASVTFLNPGTMVSPGSEDIIGVVRNASVIEENYDVHCVATDPTFATVLDTTINVTTPAGESDTLNFGAVNFVNGFTYDIMMATLLVGDENPANDTITQTTVCSSAFWEILPNMPFTSSGGYAGYQIDSTGNTLIHVFGGNPGPQATHYIYNYTTSTYAAGTALPVASTYGGTTSFNNMIYMCGAWTGAANVITIYDCDNDTYTTRTLPGGGRANPVVVSKDDRFVYVIGGYTSWQGGTAVDVYDAVADTFFGSPTQLPANCACMSAAGALVAGDTIVVAGGYDGSAAMTDRVFFGVIDSLNVGNITWTLSGTPYPGGQVYRHYGDDWQGVGYFTGGSNNSWYFTETYAYQPGAGWITLPSKPTGCSNLGWVLAPVDTQYTDDEEGLGFAMGGYIGSYLSNAEAYHTGMVLGIAEKPGQDVGRFFCKLVSSNPISNLALIQLVMPEEGPVKFSIYDVTGREVLSKDFTRIHAGTHTIRWNGESNQGTPVAAGSYFYRIEAAGEVASGKVVVVK